MTEPGSRRLAGAALVLACLVSAAGRGVAAEPPMRQGTRLLFQKTLSIQTISRGRVFSETRRIGAGDNLAEILLTNYGIHEDALPALVEAFRAINPGLDPEQLPDGETVRIPFKLEENPAGPSAPALLPAQRTYTVRRGESLWRILRNRFQVNRAAMPKALAAVARANPTVRNLDHVVAGQRLVIPESVSGKPTPTLVPLPAPPPPGGRTLLALLSDLGCRVSTSGETFLPLSRGRAIRLDDREFPIVTGPGGRRVILDPENHMSVALTRDIGEAWGYSVLQGTEADPEEALEKLLPRLGFHEVAEGPRAIRASPGLQLTARPRWSVVARPQDAWEGQVHLLFPSGTRLDPDLSALALQAGFSLHSLGTEPIPRTTENRKPLESVPELSLSEPGTGEGLLLGVLGVSHKVRPSVECDLGGGVRYHLRPDLTFDHDGTAYAVPPREPQRADTLLARAGYFTVRLPDPSTPFARLADLLALLRIRSHQADLRLPPGDEGLELSVRGLVFEAPDAARRLYPQSEAAPAKVLVTEARLPPPAARLLLKEGFAAWILNTRTPEELP